jgi:hypothetical protein
MLTSTEFCKLIGRKTKWLDTRKRRYKEKLEFKPGGTIDFGEIDPLPLREPLAEGWARYNAIDAVLMGIAIEAEDSGINFRDGVNIALHSDPKQIIEQPNDKPDVYVGNIVVDEGLAPLIRGTTNEIYGVLKDKYQDRYKALILINASDVWRRLRERARAEKLFDKLMD